MKQETANVIENKYLETHREYHAVSTEFVDFVYSLVVEDDCKHCQGFGWYTEHKRGSPPEQIQCEVCCGTGKVLPETNEEISLRMWKEFRLWHDTRAERGWGWQNLSFPDWLKEQR